MEIKNFFATNAKGDIMPDALVYVYATGTTDLATGLRDISNNPLANPFNSQANGLIQFQAPDGIYDVRVVKGSRDYTLRGIQCADLLNLIDSTKSVFDYSELREYNGEALSVKMLKEGIAGTFIRVAVSSPVDNGGLRIVDIMGRAWDREINGNVYSSWFEIPKDDGSDAYPATDRMLAASQLHNIVWEPGLFTMLSGSPMVRSYTGIEALVKHQSIIFQPNYYSYDRPTVPYNRALVVDWNGLWCDIGSHGISIKGMNLRGPFWQPDEASYLLNQVQNWPANNGFAVRGRDYQYRKSLPYTGTSSNISVTECHFEGWAEDGAQFDQVDNWTWDRNTSVHNGRGGMRNIGCLHGTANHNRVQHIFPGDYLNGRTVGGVYIGGNRAYGMEATRLYQAGCRPTEDFEYCDNLVTDCLQWKCMGTHGGVNGRFLRNTIIDGHHGIGMDKGGFTAEQGIAPPIDLRAGDNLIIRNAPGDPTEGDGEGGPGHGLFCTAHDGTEVHIGKGLWLDENTLRGWGCDNLTGGMWVGNQYLPRIGDHTVENSIGVALRLRDTIEGGVVGKFTIAGVTRSTGGVQRGISCEAATISATIGPGYFVNKDLVNPLTCIFLNDGGDVSVFAGQKLKGAGSLINKGANDIGGTFSTTPSAQCRGLVSGGTIQLRGAQGILSAVREADGVFLLTTTRTYSSTDNMIAGVTITGSARTPRADVITTNTVRVTTYAVGTSTPADNSFFFTLSGS